MTQSDIRVKRYCRLNLLRASVFYFERLDILRDSIRHPSKKLLSIEFAHNFGIQFRVSPHITVKRLEILRDSIAHPSQKVLSIEFAHNFGIQFRVSRHITGLNRTSE